jgi:hypothetical protein
VQWAMRLHPDDPFDNCTHVFVASLEGALSKVLMAQVHSGVDGPLRPAWRNTLGQQADIRTRDSL